MLADIASLRIMTRLWRALSAPLRLPLTHRNLFTQLLVRDVRARYQGSLLGILWLFIVPLAMLAVYYFVFGHIFNARWPAGEGADGQTLPFALTVFAGLTVFNVVADCWSRAPGLMTDNSVYVTKIVFPVDLLPLTVMGSALCSFAASFLMFTIFYICVEGVPFASWIYFPLLLLPLIFFVSGVSWILAALGVYLRDLRQIVPVLITALMFLSPIFYPLSSVSEPVRALLLLNPLAYILEESKHVLLSAEALHWGTWLRYLGFSYLICAGGHYAFEKLRRGFADVL